MADQVSDEPEALVKKALRFEQFGEIDAARDMLRSALEVDPDNSDIWTRLGVLYSEHGIVDKARKAFHEAIRIDSRHLQPMEQLGFLEFTEGDFEATVDVLLKYLEARGSDIDTLILLAKAACKIDDCDTLMEATSRIIKLDEDVYEAWELRGQTYAKKGKYNEACVCLNMAIDLHPASVAALNGVGDLCYEAENYLRAAEFYESSLEVNKEQLGVLFRYATSLCMLDRWMESIPLLERYTSSVSDDARGWNNLGVVLREKGEVTRAIECYKKALEVDPSLTEAQKNLETAKKELLT
jgi:tetratricopeptide (TPR) repeat protein